MMHRDRKRIPLRGAALALVLASSGCGLFNNNAYEREQQARKLVAATLVDPNSAEFRNVRGHTDVVCGEVNGKNRLGAYVGFRRFIADLKVPRAMMDPEYEPSSLSTDEQAKRLAQLEFDTRWTEACDGPGGVSAAEEPFNPTAQRSAAEENWTERALNSAAPAPRARPARRMEKNGAGGEGEGQLVVPDGNPLPESAPPDSEATENKSDALDTA